MRDDKSGKVVAWETPWRIWSDKLPGIIRDTSRRLQQTTVRHGDGWQLAADAPADALVFVDTCYFPSDEQIAQKKKVMNYGRTTLGDGNPLQWFKKFRHYLLPKGDSVRYVITNNFNSQVVEMLEQAGWSVLQSYRGNPKSPSYEFIALSPAAAKSIHLRKPAARRFYPGGLPRTDAGFIPSLNRGTASHQSGLPTGESSQTGERDPESSLPRTAGPRGSGSRSPSALERTLSGGPNWDTTTSAQISRELDDDLDAARDFENSLYASAPHIEDADLESELDDDFAEAARRFSPSEDTSEDEDSESPTLFAAQRVTPAQDAEYMQAVRDGDVAKQQALVDAAAKKAGKIHIFDKNIKTAFGSRYYHATYKGDWFEVRLSDHSNTSAQGRQDSATFDGLRAQKSDAGMDKPHRLNVTLTNVVKTEKEAKGIIDDVLRGLPDEAIFRTKFEPLSWQKGVPTKIYGNDSIEVRFYNGRDIPTWEYNFEGEDGERFDDVPPKEKTPVEMNQPGFGPQISETESEGLALTNTGTSNLPVNSKSADPITRDAEGNVIPLSQRFNPESNSMLFAAPRQFTSSLHASLANAAATSKRETGSLPVPTPTPEGSADTPVRFRPSSIQHPASSIQQAAPLAESTLQGYFDFPDVAIPPSKQPAASAEIRAAAATSSNPYGVPARSGTTGRLDGVRERARRTWNGFLGHDAEAIRAAFQEQDHFSTLIHQFVSRDVPNFDIRGAILESPADLAAFCLATRTPYFESLKIAILDGAHQVIHSQVVHVGGLNEAVADPKVIAGIIASARMANPKAKLGGWMIAHNHPSGDPSPSEADLRATRVMRDMGKALGLPLLDHVVTNGEKFFSFRERRILDYVIDDSIDERPTKATKPKLPILPTPTAPAPGTLADWEVIPSGSTKAVMSRPALGYPYLKALRTADPDHYHVLYLDTKLALRGVERFPTTLLTPQLFQKIVLGSAREGAFAFMISMPNAETASGAASQVNEYTDSAAPNDAQRRLVRAIREYAKNIGLSFADAMSHGGQRFFSFQEHGLMEEPGEILPAAPRRAYESMAFDPPFKTPFGDILSYDWMSQPVGNLSSQRTSDWSRARTNPATGRDIVHHFKVRKPDGIHTVSLETALGQLSDTQRHHLQTLIKSEQRRREESAAGQLTLFAAQRQADTDRFQQTYGAGAQTPLRLPKSTADFFNTPEIPFHIGNDIPVPVGGHIRAAQIIQRSSSKGIPNLYRLSVIENAQGETYSQVEKHLEHQGSFNAIHGSFEKLSTSEIERDHSLNEAAAKQWKTVQSEQGQGMLFAAPRQFTSSLHVSLANAAATSKRETGSLPVPAPTPEGSADTPVRSGSATPLLQQAYASASLGQSSVMLPLRRVFDHAKALQPTLTPADFLRTVKLADDSGQVLLEPYDTPAGLEAAKPFILRNASGVPCVSMALAEPESDTGSLPVPAANRTATPLENSPLHAIFPHANSPAQWTHTHDPRASTGDLQKRQSLAHQFGGGTASRPNRAFSEERIARDQKDQRAALSEIAQRPQSPAQFGGLLDHGGEHAVYISSDARHVTKVTLPGFYGYVPTEDVAPGITGEFRRLKLRLGTQRTSGNFPNNVAAFPPTSDNCG